jgi:predicted membrane channel-forming protein YqfA (hemolysin III family)
MEGHAYMGELLTSIVYLIAGVRLLRLARRTGEAPERLLGATFLFMGVSAVFYVLPVFSAFESLWTPLTFAGRVTFLPAAVMLVLFTRRVFRPDPRWGAWLVWGTPILLVTGVGGSAWGGDWEGYSISNGWFWLEWVGFSFPFGWAGSEAFIQYRQARRRVRLGLCDPLVCSRYLLWALFGALQACSCLVLLPQYSEYETTSHFTATWDALYGASIIASLVMIWLVFFPPTFYRNWINRFATLADAAEEGSPDGG